MSSVINLYNPSVRVSHTRFQTQQYITFKRDTTARTNITCLSTKEVFALKLKEVFSPLLAIPVLRGMHAQILCSLQDNGVLQKPVKQDTKDYGTTCYTARESFALHSP